MATLTQIGAVIGMKGAKEYINELKVLSQYTKEFASETTKLTSSFGTGNRTIAQTNNLRKAMQTQLDGLNNKLRYQQEQYGKVTAAMKDSQGLYGKQAEGVSAWKESINETETEINNLKNQMKDLPSSLELVTDAFKNGDKQLNLYGETLKGIGDAMTKYITVPMMAFAGVGVKTFSDWESAFIGVKKTVEGTPEELEAIAQGISDMALRTASSREEIAAVAEAAGQLGIATQDVLGFTEVMVMLGDTTNLSADEAATALARIVNITGESTSADNMMRLGSAIVHLGNNFATTEAEIVQMSNRLAAGGTIAGLTTTEIFGLATAMSSVGITAEAGGTAMTQTLSAIEKEVVAFSTGAESHLDKIAEIAGMSADQFAVAWEERPAEAVQAFISGLGQLDEKGESATLVLDELGMSGIRQSNMLKSLALASETLGDAMTKANEGYTMMNENGETFNALAEEASKRYESFDSQVNQLKESFKTFSSSVGKDLAQLLLPMVEGLTTLFTKLSEGWNNMSEIGKSIVLALGTFMTVIGPILSIAGTIIIFIGKIKSALEVLGITWKVAAAVIGGVSATVLGVIAAIVAVIAVIKNWGAISEWLTTTWEKVKEGISFTWYALGEACKEAWNLIKEVFTTIVETIKTFVTEKFTAMKDGAVKIFENLKTAISTRVTGIKNAIVNGLTQAINWIKNLPSQALQWGKDIIGNLISGITSKISGVTDAIRGVADKIRNLIGFSEPKLGPLSDFHTYMPDMMKLMAQGINDNAYLVEDALSNVAGAMGSQMGGQSVSYGGVVINLNVPEGANGRMLVDEIETELANRTLRRRAVFS